MILIIKNKKIFFFKFEILIKHKTFSFSVKTERKGIFPHPTKNLEKFPNIFSRFIFVFFVFTFISSQRNVTIFWSRQKPRLFVWFNLFSPILGFARCQKPHCIPVQFYDFKIIIKLPNFIFFFYQLP